MATTSTAGRAAQENSGGLVTIHNKLTMTEAGRLVGKSPSCIFRWYRDGVAGETLDALFLGGSFYTSEEAIEDFGRRVSAVKRARRDRTRAATSTRPVAVDGL